MSLSLSFFFYLSLKDEQISDFGGLDRALLQPYKGYASQRVRERFGDAVIDIPGHETILRPKETVQKLCDHLGVTCTEDYIEKCSKILYGAPSVTRNKIVWTDEQKGGRKVNKNISYLE